MKNVTLFIVMLISILACKTPESQNASNQKLIEKYFEYFNAHDFKNMANMYIPNAEFKDPSLGTGIIKQSQQEVIKKYAELAQIFPDLKDTILKMYTAGDENVIVEFISTGTAPDKTSFELPICTIFTIKAGKISQDFTYYDNN